MKRNLLTTFAAAAAALLLMGGGEMHGGHGSGGGTVYRRHRVSVPRPSMPKAGGVVNDRGRAAYPERDGSGARISQHAASSPPSQHAAVVRNEGFARGMRGLERTETVPGHYYWHNDGGIRYSHYYDGHYHWYGFYHGANFYWTRYDGNRWWWFDGGFGRWVFWWDGYWWWDGPGGTAYVYMDNNYYPYEDSGVDVEQPVTLTPPASHPEPDKSAVLSPDGRRSAQIVGDDAQAFLYDKTSSPPKFLKYLGQGVTKVRFSGGSGGAPLQVLAEFKDGTFALYDADGNSQSAAVESTESKSTPPPAAPDSVPPPPTTAPGQ